MYFFRKLTGSGDKLFFGARTYQYRAELHECDVSTKTLSAANVSASKIHSIINNNFIAIVYPKPAHGDSTLNISGDAKNISFTITDISGKTIWSKAYNGQHTISMRVATMASGVYLVIVRNSKETKTLKFVKE